MKFILTYNSSLRYTLYKYCKIIIIQLFIALYKRLVIFELEIKSFKLNSYERVENH